MCSSDLHFSNTPTSIPVQIDSLGWQLQTSSSYFFDNQKRPAEQGNYIFQYTLSGSGILKTTQTHYTLSKGTAFFTSIPATHQYYLPASSPSWEFIFVTLKGDYVHDVWHSILDKNGPIINLPLEDPFVSYLWDFYFKCCDLTDQNLYDVSSKGYDFLMKLQQRLFTLPIDLRNAYYLPDAIDKAILYMNDNLSANIGLEDISTSVKMSKFHFNRLFQQKAGIAPWAYFTKLRIEHAARLLLTTELVLTEIATQCGYDNANYFNKVFRKYVGLSPGQFRSTYSHINDFTLQL